MPTNKILTPMQDYERIIRACYAEEKGGAEKETLVNESLSMLSEPNRKLWRLEDAETGTLKGYDIQDVAQNSIKTFYRK